MFFRFVQLIRPLRYGVDKIFYMRSRNAIHREKLHQIKGKYRGKPMLIVGNGPSLNKTPLGDFNGIAAIGMNKINLLFDRVDWRPSLILSSNPLVVKQNQDFFAGTDIPVFLSWKNRWLIGAEARNSVNYYLQINTQEFSKDISLGIGAGATITFAAMQFAHYMGANPVILFGIDHSFATKGPANKVVISKEDDASHFDPNYFGKGVWWQLPDLVFSERAYCRAKQAFKEDNRIIYDATIDGKLQVFDKISVDDARKLCDIS